jgi:hypothetical protein
MVIVPLRAKRSIFPALFPIESEREEERRGEGGCVFCGLKIQLM